MLHSRRGRNALIGLAVVAVLITCTGDGTMDRGSRSLTGPAFVAALAVSGELDLSTSGAQVVGPGDAIFRQSAFGTSSGTGLVNPFLKTSTNDATYNAFNTSGTPKPTTVANNTDARDLPLSWVPTVTINDVTYREFRLDINEPGGGKNLLSLDSLKLYITDQGNVPSDGNNLPNFPSGANARLVYNLDANNTDSWLKMDADLSPGSGGGDVFMYIPEALFGTDGAQCPYDGAVGPTGCGKFLYLVARFGDNYPNNGGFEEFAVRQFPYVTKTAEYMYDQDVTWTISKKVKKSSDADDKFAPSASFDLWDGDDGTANFQVTVDKTVTPKNNRIEGTITVHNPTNVAYSNVNVIDEFQGITATTLSCNTTTLGSGSPNNPATIVCTYTVALDQVPALPATNTATATFLVAAGSDVSLSLSGTAQVAGPGTVGTTTGFQTITVNDDDKSPLNDDKTPLGAASDDKTFDVYNRMFTCPDHIGDNDNTAEIAETKQTASAKVTLKCYSLTIAKTAEPAFTRTFTWTIQKDVTPDEINIFKGDKADAEYTVTLDRTVSDGSYSVGGTITVTNPSSSSDAIDVAKPSDAISGTGAPAVTPSCKEAGNDIVFPKTLAPGQSFTCTYQAALPNNVARDNQASVEGTIPNTDNSKTFDSDVVPFDPSSAVPSTVGSEAVKVTDDNDPSSPRGPFSDDASFSYTKEYECNADDGDQKNTAILVDAQTADPVGPSDDATVTVHCHTLTVSKTAVTTLIRTYNWELLKTAADPTSFILDPGEIYSHSYTVVASVKDHTDSDWKVDGSITVKNNNPARGADLNSLEDVVSDNLSADISGCAVGQTSVDYPLPPDFTLDAQATLTCNYSRKLDNGDDGRTNTATVVQQNHSYDKDGNEKSPDLATTTSWEGKADVNFPPDADNITIQDNCLEVKDEGDLGNTDPLGTVCVAGTYPPPAGAFDAPHTFQYTRLVPTGPERCGEFTYNNTATGTTNTTSHELTSNASITVTINCTTGCTLTLGYWKTHSTYGPAAHPDPDWDLVGGPDATFFKSGHTWFEVFWTPPKGNVYYNLAHQYMAAVLNTADGTIASVPAQVKEAIDAATAYFNTVTPDYPLTKSGVGGYSYKKSDVLGWAGTLGSFNEGNLGIPHCEEDGDSNSGDSPTTPVLRD